MKSSNLYSQLKNNFKIVSENMNREGIKHIASMCVYIICIFKMKCGKSYLHFIYLTVIFFEKVATFSNSQL